MFEFCRLEMLDQKEPRQMSQLSYKRTTCLQLRTWAASYVRHLLAYARIQIKKGETSVPQVTLAETAFAN